MNGASPRNQYGADTGRLSPAPLSQGPGGRALVEGYRKDVLNNFEKEKPRYNPMNRGRPQSSILVDLKDPIQIHLLTETALSDSKKYEILSQDEADDLKKQCQSLTQRIEQARTNLAIQSKYRDAAISMSKLYAPGAHGKRRSLLSNRTSGEAIREAEVERQASEKKCEDLAAELWSLEKRLMEPQRRLLEHTAGILQLTHNASKKAAVQPVTQPVNGIPGSPESMYTYSNGRNSLDPSAEDAYFDDRSLYMPFDQMDNHSSRPRKNTLEIPLKSPIREQQSQLREETDRLREENSRLRQENDQLRVNTDAVTLEIESLQRESSDQLQIITGSERKLEDLNTKLREAIVRFDPSRNGEYESPPPGPRDGTMPGPELEDLMRSQLKYLETGLDAIGAEQSAQSAEKDARRRDSDTAAAAVAATLTDIEGRVEDLTRQVQEVIQNTNLTHPPPPQASISDLDGQLDYLGDSLRIFEVELSRATEGSQAASAEMQKLQQVDDVLMGLWEIIQSGYAAIRKEKEDRRRARMDMGLGADDDDMSGDESLDTNEPYSIAAFSARVQWLYAQATSLKEQKSVLKRQIKQQRELNNKTESEKELELKLKLDELQQTRDLLVQTEQEARVAKEKLAESHEELEALQQTRAADESSAARVNEAQLQERNAKIASLEADTQALQSKLAALETNLASVTAQLAEANEAKEAAGVEVENARKEAQDAQMLAEANAETIQKSVEADMEKMKKDLKDKDDELDRVSVMVAELKTEVTIAKAELDGAYGSRSERAAEAAKLSKSSENSALQTDNDRLKGENDTLRSELGQMTKEFEEMTKETIASEREKLDLEGKLDDILSTKMSLENEIKGLRQRLDRLQEELDSEKLRGQSAGAGRGAAGASALSEQFRATMREERKKFQEDLREERQRARKLEDEVRLLRKSQGPGRSPLSPR